jgi:rod shape-determining protein MreD
MMPWMKYAIAFGSIVVLTVLAALPWGLPSEDRFFLPLLPVVAIQYWTLRHPRLIPEWFVFLAGLGLDVLTHGPLGYWSLVYLSGYFIAAVLEPYAHSGQIVRLAFWIVAMMITTFAAWAVSSVYFLEFADWRPFAHGMAFALVAGAVLVPMLHALDPEKEAHDNPQLSRGG